MMQNGNTQEIKMTLEEEEPIAPSNTTKKIEDRWIDTREPIMAIGSLIYLKKQVINASVNWLK